MLIGISGKFSSGKDTLALKILEKGGLHLKFADKVKEICSIISGTKLEDNYSTEGKEQYIENLEISIGRFQQLLGTKLREIHSDIWIFPVIELYKKNSDKICVISDVRFRNEADHIKKNGGILIRINRIRGNGNVGRDPLHISETDFDNNGTIEEMVEKAFSFLKI